MFVNLLAAIEADINKTVEKINEVRSQPKYPYSQIEELISKKDRLMSLAAGYIDLEHKYKEESRANSIY